MRQRRWMFLFLMTEVPRASSTCRPEPSDVLSLVCPVKFMTERESDCPSCGKVYECEIKCFPEAELGQMMQQNDSGL